MKVRDIEQLKIKSKPKFNKHKCLNCKYHNEITYGHYVRVKVGDKYKQLHVGCDYANITHQTCLYLYENKQVQDRRGTDYNNCLLYEQGKIKAIDKSKRNI